MKNLETFQERSEEFINLNNKRDFTKGFQQGLSNEDYDRINSLHSFLLSSEEGIKVLDNQIN